MLFIPRRPRKDTTTDVIAIPDDNFHNQTISDTAVDDDDDDDDDNFGKNCIWEKVLCHI